MPTRQQISRKLQFSAQSRLHIAVAEKEYYDLTQQFALERLKQYGVTGAVAIGCAAATIEPFTGE